MRLKHRSLLGITILTILTFGIYHIYWYFITKTEMHVINGKTIKAPVAGIKLDSGGDSLGAFVIATLPGDLRVKGGTVVVSGNYSLAPCK